MAWTIEERLEKFGVANEDGEIVIDREAMLRGYIERGVYVLKEQDTLKEDFKAIIAEAKEDSYDTANLKALIKHTYKNQIAEEIAELETIQQRLNDLFGED